jgi:DNA-binding response OmpR family regulator
MPLVYVDDEELILTKTEAAVLYQLTTGPKSRADLLVETQRVPREIAHNFSTRSLDMTVSRLRKTLGKHRIKSIRGVGYILQDIEVI